MGGEGGGKNKRDKRSKGDSLFQLFSTGHNGPVVAYLFISAENFKNKLMNVADTLLWSFSKQEVIL